MGKRLSKIYTRTGDAGYTAVSDNKRISKNSALIITIGAIDELNSALGMILSQSPPQPIAAILARIQQDLFDLGGELSYPPFSRINASRVSWLEQSLDELNADLPALKEFVLPGGQPIAAQAHWVRTICRRAECDLVNYHQQQPLKNPILLQYLNRLSDLLFVIARSLNAASDMPEVLWSNGASLI